jgi:hypothetical protein
MGEYNLSDPTSPCAADQTRSCDRVVGRPKRPLGEQFVTSELSDDAVDAHHFDRLGASERRED